LTESALKRALDSPNPERLAGAWSGDVSSPPVEFEIPTTNDTPAQELIWGPASHGLRTALEFIPRQQTHNPGETVDVRMHVQNMTEEPITLLADLFLPWLTMTAIDLQNNPVQVHALESGDWTTTGRMTLIPGQATVFNAGNIVLVEDELQANVFKM
jgi:hypothetical protein